MLSSYGHGTSDTHRSILYIYLFYGSKSTSCSKSPTQDLAHKKLRGTLVYDSQRRVLQGDCALTTKRPETVVKQTMNAPACPSTPQQSTRRKKQATEGLNPFVEGYPFSPYRRRKLNGSSSSLSSAATQKLKVTFNETVQIRKFVPTWALPPEDEAELGSTGECASNNESTVQLRQLDFSYLKVMRQTADPSEWASMLKEDWSPRGLEMHFDNDYLSKRRKSKLQTCLTILLLQAREQSVEEIARQYASVSKPSQARAHRQGLLDELDANHGLGPVVLSAIKKCNDDKTEHAMRLRRAMQELKFHPGVCGSNTNGSPAHRRSQRFSTIFIV